MCTVKKSEAHISGRWLSRKVRQRRTNVLLEGYAARRTAIPDDVKNEVDMAFDAAHQRCQDLLPGGEPPELRERNDAWKEFNEANERRERAQDELDRQSENADRSAERLHSARSGPGRSGSADLDRLEAAAASDQRSRDRALARLREREAEQDAAKSAYDGAKADWDKLRQPYDDCMREQLHGLGSSANQGRGFTESDLEYLRIMYPEFADPPPANTPTSVSSSGNWFGMPRMLVLGGGGIFAMAMVGIVLVFGGGGGNGDGTYVATDPLNDFAPTWADKEPIDNPSSAGDVTNLKVVVAGGNTTVTLTFAGAAQDLLVEGGEELSAALQFLPVGEERFIDMLLSEDGSVKISDPPSGARITATWTASNVLVFEITGVTPTKGATVRFEDHPAAGLRSLQRRGERLYSRGRLGTGDSGASDLRRLFDPRCAGRDPTVRRDRSGDRGGDRGNIDTAESKRERSSQGLRLSHSTRYL